VRGREKVLYTNYEAEKDAVAAAYRAYTRAFLANDMDAIDRLGRYPLAYIGAGTTVMLDSFPVKPADLIAEKQCTLPPILSLRWLDSRQIRRM